MILQPGQQIDRFVVERPLGEGGMAAVYRVRHSTLDAVYALKILTIPSASVRDRMLREGRFQATLRHSNIVSVIDVLDIHGVLGLLMEYVDGPPLDVWLQSYRPTLREALAVFGGILSAVDMVHARGIIHRDLKPANVLLQITDEGVYPRVTDFGFAKRFRISDVNTGTGATIGTPAYMAPEQFKDASKVDQRADVFSLGALLYELVTGQRAFHNDNLLAMMNDVAKGVYIPPEQLVPDLPDGVRTAIAGALRPDPAERISDCKRLAAVLTGQSAVHNIADAMQRRLFRSSAGARHALSLREERLRREMGDNGSWGESIPPIDRTFSASPSRRKATSSTIVATYDEPLGVFTEEVPRNSDRAPAMPASQYAVLLMFGLILVMGVLVGVTIAVVSGRNLSAPVPVPTVTSNESGLRPGQAVAVSELMGTAPEPTAPAPAPAPAPTEPTPATTAPAPAPSAAPVAAPVPSPTPAAVPPGPAASPEPVAARPRPRPAPEPEPVPEPPPTPTGSVGVTGGVQVQLVGPGGTHGPGVVPAGTYEVRADFGSGYQQAAQVTVPEGGSITLSCDAAFLVCRAQ